VDVDRDDALGLRDARALDRVQPHAADAEDRDAAAGLDARRVPDGAHAGHHRAADQRRLLERRVVRELDRGLRRHHRALRHRAERRESLQLVAVRA
jgi:hypothetical protein